MKIKSIPSITTGKKDWRDLSRQELMQMAHINPKFFRGPKGFPDSEKVEALAAVLTPKEVEAFAPNDQSFERRYNAAIGYLRQSPLWTKKPLPVDWNAVIGMDSSQFTNFAVQYCYSKRVRRVV